MKRTIILIAAVLVAQLCVANELQQQYEKAYYLEVAKGQSDKALEIYRQIAATPATDESRKTILLALSKLQHHYEIPHVLPFEIGLSEFENGDSINISEIRSTTEAFEEGGTYYVTGTYNLQSQDEATLTFYLTKKEASEPTQIKPSQRIRITKGSGTFELINTFTDEGWPHLSFYPLSGGRSFGNIYFGSEEWLRRKPFGHQQQDRSNNILFDSNMLQSKVDDFDMTGGTLETVLSTFGDPRGYVLGKETFTKENLPDVYLMLYPEQFTILMNKDRVQEFRFERSTAYSVKGIHNGITLQEAFRILGEPKSTLWTGKIDWKEDTLYITTSGKWSGHAYFATKGLRLFFKQDVLFSIYITDNTQQTSIGTLGKKSTLAPSRSSSLQTKVDSFDIKNGEIKDVLSVFGEPDGYYFGQKKFSRSSRPEAYAMTYPSGFSVWMLEDRVREFRFENKLSDETSYEIAGITIGSSFEEVFKTLGQPKKTVVNKECTYGEGVLYKNSKGRPSGWAYYSAKGLRLFFMDEKVVALYVTDNTILAGE